MIPANGILLENNFFADIVKLSLSLLKMCMDLDKQRHWEGEYPRGTGARKVAATEDQDRWRPRNALGCQKDGVKVERTLGIKNPMNKEHSEDR